MGALSVRCSRALASITRQVAAPARASQSGADHRRTRHPRAGARRSTRFTPSAIFLDSLSNTNWMPVPDLPSVIERLTGTDTYLVVDNTGLSVSCQAFALAGDSVRLIVFESLLKYAPARARSRQRRCHRRPPRRRRRARPVPRASRDQHRRRRRARAPATGPLRAPATPRAPAAKRPAPRRTPTRPRWRIGEHRVPRARLAPIGAGEPPARVPRRLPVDRIPRARPRTATRTRARRASDRRGRQARAWQLLAGLKLWV